MQGEPIGQDLKDGYFEVSAVCLHSERFGKCFAIEVIKHTGRPTWLLLHAIIKATLFQILALLVSSG